MKTKKGFTTVELIVSISLCTIIVFFLIELIFIIKDIYSDSGIKTKLLAKQALLSEKINHDFRTKKLTIATSCGNNCVEFLFNDGTQKQLKYRRDEEEIIYGNFKEELVDGSSFGDVIIRSESLADSNDTKELNGILTIHIPIYNKYFEKEDFGITVVYQFNSNTTSIAGINLKDAISSGKKIMLVGSSTDVKIEGTKYNDPGYYLFNPETGQMSLNDPSIKVTGNIGNEPNTTYTLYYKFYNENGIVADEIQRKITVVKQTYDFEYTGKEEEIQIPISGIYKLEAWGASGGGSSTMKGLGGYSSGNYTFTKGTTVKVYVGGSGVTATSGVAAKGGFNGGGNSGVSTTNLASSGGGASDIRVNDNKLSSRILVAGGGGGGGCRNDSSYTCSGGAGGGTNGLLAGTCSAASYIGTGGSQTAGGLAAAYTANCTSYATAGTLLTGGMGSTYSNGSSTYAAGGGGGGYYGGGGGSRYGGGAGGSGYCSPDIQSCNLSNGTSLFSAPDGKTYELGHNGNGFVKITLVSITG